MWYVDIYIFFLSKACHYSKSTRALIPLLAGYSLRVAAEVVAMTIILQFSVTVTAQFRREDFEKSFEFFSRLPFFSFFMQQKQTTERRLLFRLERGIHFVITHSQHKHRRLRMDSNNGR